MTGRDVGRLCAHADQDGEGAHWLAPGETCTVRAALPQQTAWDLFLSMPTICGVESAGLTAVMQDFAGLLDVDGVLDGLPLPTDQRAYVALLGMAFVVWDEPAAELRRRADLVLTREGRGPVTNQPAFSRALRRTADLFEMELWW